jgi:hypothetical protein
MSLPSLSQVSITEQISSKTSIPALTLLRQSKNQKQTQSQAFVFSRCLWFKCRVEPHTCCEFCPFCGESCLLPLKSEHASPSPWAFLQTAFCGAKPGLCKDPRRLATEERRKTRGKTREAKTNHGRGASKPGFLSQKSLPTWQRARGRSRYQPQPIPFWQQKQSLGISTFRDTL